MNPSISDQTSPASRPTHTWLRKITLAYVPGPTTLLLDEVAGHLLGSFRDNGHTILDHPADPPGAEVLLTTAVFGEPIPWRESMQLTARRRFKMERAPTVITLLHARPDRWQEIYRHMEKSLAKEKPDPADFAFPGLREVAFHTLIEQGLRAGPIMAMV